jgi:hypothetical protein
MNLSLYYFKQTFLRKNKLLSLKVKKNKNKLNKETKNLWQKNQKMLLSKSYLT